MFNNVPGAVLVTSIVSGAFLLALVAVALSQKAQTAGVIGAASSGLGSIITAAVAPVTGGGGSSVGGSGGYLGNAVTSAGFGSFLTA